jgi:hypothetical protein
MVYSELFYNVFKALNLFFNKYVAEIQLPGNGIWLLTIHGLALVINVKKIKEQRGATAVDSSLQLSIFAQILRMASPFKLPPQCKTCSLTFPRANLGKMAIRAVL